MIIISSTVYSDVRQMAIMLPCGTANICITIMGKMYNFKKKKKKYKIVIYVTDEQYCIKWK